MGYYRATEDKPFSIYELTLITYSKYKPSLTSFSMAPPSSNYLMHSTQKCHTHAKPLRIIIVTVYGKTRHMGSACYSRNAHFHYLRSKNVKVQFLSYSCQRTFLLTFAVVYGG